MSPRKRAKLAAILTPVEAELEICLPSLPSRYKSYFLITIFACGSWELDERMNQEITVYTQKLINIFIVMYIQPV